MKTMSQFPFLVEAPDDDDPFYGHPAFPNAMVINKHTTKEYLFAVVIHYDGEGRVRLWVCRERKFIVMRTDSKPMKGDHIRPMDTDAAFFCNACGKANDLWLTNKHCGVCVSRCN